MRGSTHSAADATIAVAGAGLVVRLQIFTLIAVLYERLLDVGLVTRMTGSLYPIIAWTFSQFAALESALVMGCLGACRATSLWTIHMTCAGARQRELCNYVLEESTVTGGC